MNSLFRLQRVLDSLNSCRYAEAMPATQTLFALILAAMVASLSVMAQASEAPVLAVLEHRYNLLPARADIRARLGVVNSQIADKPRAVWNLREGATLNQEHSPAARFIKFVHLSANSPQILCSVVVRYTRSERGWRPAYLLLQLPTMVWDGEKFVPRPGTSTREPTQLINASEPAGDGYFHNLSFGLASGPVQITAWEVQ